MSWYATRFIIHYPFMFFSFFAGAFPSGKFGKNELDSFMNRGEGGREGDSISSRYRGDPFFRGGGGRRGVRSRRRAGFGLRGLKSSRK